MSYCRGCFQNDESRAAARTTRTFEGTRRHWLVATGTRLVGSYRDTRDCMGTLLYFAFRRYQRAAYRRAGVQWLTELEADSADVQMLSRALKATALKAYSPNSRWIVWDDWPNFLVKPAEAG